MQDHDFIIFDKCDWSKWLYDNNDYNTYYYATYHKKNFQMYWNSHDRDKSTVNYNYQNCVLFNYINKKYEVVATHNVCDYDEKLFMICKVIEYFKWSRKYKTQIIIPNWFFDNDHQMFTPQHITNATSYEIINDGSLFTVKSNIPFIIFILKDFLIMDVIGYISNFMLNKQLEYTEPFDANIHNIYETQE